MTTQMISTLQAALTALEVYRMTGHEGMIDMVDLSLRELAAEVHRQYAADSAPGELAEVAEW